MEFSIKSGSPEKQRTGCLVVGVYEGRKLAASAQALDAASGRYLSAILRRGDLEGALGRTLLLHNVPQVPAERVLLVGPTRCTNSFFPTWFLWWIGKPFIRRTVGELDDALLRRARRSAARLEAKEERVQGGFQHRRGAGLIRSIRLPVELEREHQRNGGQSGPDATGDGAIHERAQRGGRRTQLHRQPDGAHGQQQRHRDRRIERPEQTAGADLQRERRAADQTPSPVASSQRPLDRPGREPRLR